MAVPYGSQDPTDTGGLAVLDLARGSFGRLPGEGGWGPLWSADVTVSSSFSAGRPRLLFKGRFMTLGGPTGFDVSPDGRRFLKVEDLGAPPQPATRLHVVLGWREELRRATARAGRSASE